MDELDWQTASEHFKSDKEADYIISSAKIVKDFFSSPDKFGILRLKENTLYKRYIDEFDPYIPDFISDLNSLFNLS